MATPIGTNQYGDDIYQTPNGQRTGTQITQELAAAGWDGVGDPVTVYNRTAAAGATPAAADSISAPGPPSEANVDAQTALFNAANQKALIEYYYAKLNLDTDELAFKKATQAFQNTISEAGLTGTYQGQPTLPALNQYAQLFGTYGVPTQGQQTLAAQQQQQNTALQYLKLLSDLRGPANIFQYQKVLGATPGGIQDLVRAAAGQYVPGTGATTGVQPTPVSLQSFIGEATGGGAGTSAADQAALQSLVPPNQMAPQTWRALAPSQQQVLLAAWENQGYRPEDARRLLEQSLPQYAPTSLNTGTFRLQ